MPREFWEWYDRQGYPMTSRELWGLEEKIKKDILLGMMIHFLYEKGQCINPTRIIGTFNAFYDWVDKGVEWNAQGE